IEQQGIIVAGSSQLDHAGRILLTATFPGDRTLFQVRDRATGKPAPPLPGQAKLHRAARLSPDGRLVALDQASTRPGAGELVLCNAITGREVGGRSLAGKGASSLAFTRDGRPLIAALPDSEADEDGRRAAALLVVETATGKKIRTRALTVSAGDRPTA